MTGSMAIEVRKVVSVVETTRREMGREVAGLHRKVATAVVFTNPLAGTYVEDLTELVAFLEAEGVVVVAAS